MDAEATPLELTAADRDRLARAALDWCLAYTDSFGARELYPPTSAAALAAIVGEPLPQTPLDTVEVLAQFSEIAAHARDNGHPRMFGYVQSSAAFAGAIADLLASTLNQNVTSWRSAPSATTVERQVIAWLAEIIGMPATAGGLFLSGGSLANLTALAAAIRAASAGDVAQIGVAALGREPRIYASPMVHMSIPKAIGLLGLGRRSIHEVPVNASFELEPAALAACLRKDREDGRLPICVVGTAGDVNTGAIDPLHAIADLCAEHGVWFHVDASYGGFAALAPSMRGRLAGLARADSVALDPHKWLFAPIDAGCLLVRDPAALHRAFAHGASYVDVVADEGMSEFAFWDYGPELSRRFRALKIWFALKLHGAHAFAEAIEANLRVAGRLADVIDGSADLERLAPVPLSIVCFRYVPPAWRDRLRAGDPAARDHVDALNRRIMLAVQREGAAYLSNATIHGAFALRACIVNHRTTEADVPRLLDAVRRAAR